MDGTPFDPGQHVSVEEASELLEVTADRVQIMVDEGLLVPIEGSDPRRFVRAEVIALRELGG